MLAENKNGRFSVRSAYKVVQEDSLDGEMVVCPSSSALRKVWRCLWGMNMSNKIKQFVWKACTNILATKENLRRRNITDNGVCEYCGTHTLRQSITFFGSVIKPRKYSPRANYPCLSRCCHHGNLWMSCASYKSGATLIRVWWSEQ